MGDVFTTVITLTPAVLEALEVVIELLKQILARTTKERNDIKEDLVGLQIDLGFIKHISSKIMKIEKMRNSDDLKPWTEEASRVVTDAKTLLRNIEKQNDRPQRWWRCKKEQFRCSKNDTQQLNELRRRCDNLNKHNETILTLYKQYRCRSKFGWLFCGCCG